MASINICKSYMTSVDDSHQKTQHSTGGVLSVLQANIEEICGGKDSRSSFHARLNAIPINKTTNECRATTTVVNSTNANEKSTEKCLVEATI